MNEKEALIERIDELEKVLKMPGPRKDFETWNIPQLQDHKDKLIDALYCFYV